MSVRGKPPNLRPITPPDPSLTIRPVPHTRHFPVQSFGPGAAADILTTARPLRDIDEQANPPGYDSPVAYYLHRDEIRRLLAAVERWEAVTWHEDRHAERDPTWGFYIFVTAYSKPSRERLPQAIANLVKTVHLRLGLFAVPIYAQEAFKRFKLSVIQDKDALSNASDDRLRDEFRAQIRGLQLFDDEGLIPPPARNMACLVFDESMITTLADVPFPEDTVDYHRMFGDTVKVKVLDAWWHRLSASNESSYRGVGNCDIFELPRLYSILTSNANSSAMEDLHPMDRGF